MIRPYGRLRRAAAGAVIAVLAAGATLIAAEAGLRLLLPQALLHDPDAFEPDPILGGRLRPGFAGVFTSAEFSTRWEINASGHRGPAAGARRAGVTRIAAIGDSFTFGYGVEEADSWPRRLEADLNAGAPGRCEVINLGVGGYGTAQEVAWLEENLDRGLDPDLVLAGFYPGNDLSDSVRGIAAARAARERARDAARDAGRADPAAAAALPTRTERLKRWMASRSHLYALVADRADGLLVRLGLRRVVYPEEVDVLLAPETRAVREGWEAVRSSLGRLSRLAAARGFRAAVVAIPMRHQVAPASWARVRDYYARVAGAPPADADLDLPRRRLAEIAASEDLDLVDLVPPFRRAGDPGRLYFRRDQHWTREGHALAAAAIAERLSGMRLEPRGEGGAAIRDSGS